MHRHTRPILILSIATLLATGVMLWLVRDSGGLRGPAEAMPPVVADAARQDQAPTQDAGNDAAARMTSSSSYEAPAPDTAQHAVVDPDAAETAYWRAVQQFSFEQGVVVPDGLSQQGSDALLRAEDFAQRIAEAVAESGRDPEAADVTRVYREAVERTLRENSSPVRLAGLACGTQLCVGVLVGGRVEDYSAWAEVFPKRGGAPIYALNTHNAEDAGGAPTLRFVFTIDPAYGGVVVEGV